MYLSHYAEGARSAARARNRLKKEGYVFGLRRVWSGREEEVCRLFWPDVRQIKRLLWSRSEGAIRAKGRALGLPIQKQHIWSAASLSRLRRLYPEATWDELHAAFPGVSKNSILHAVRYRRLRKNRRPYKPTGYLLIDEIRGRCFELNYRMKDIDALAMSKRYFYKAGWHSRWISHKAIARAVAALDGQLTVKWSSIVGSCPRIETDRLSGSFH